ncbi:DUF3616 domain-containing protein [Lyngbya sp. CCY1209]|uniref:DUF3616 domain-containing protein n=1 Tax=Lyngbya sp. CCY1209 TaxID=2886103 RepID=UPI002D210654|nr:DUF3616 domain-containing protein [Lyngbya sp. CCY1209]MEB3887345.1 DUF3616 domain-containing protein [Lyngbya sp. CCY1209]
MPDAFLLSRVVLRFDAPDDDLITDLSAIALTPDGSLWVGSDELLGLDRLSPVEPFVYGKHQHYGIENYIQLWNDDDEIDIEGLDYSDDYLWFTGSHSTKRKKPKGKSTEKDLKRLSTIAVDLNRFLLARIPIWEGEPAKICEPSIEPDKSLRAACLETSERRNILIEHLREDEHLGLFLNPPIPSKDNGLDVEGIAVRENTIFLGLRGPVLRGWAVILELEIEETEPGVLNLKDIGKDGAAYKKHFVDLAGLGIRELCFDGDDLLIMAGPTMALEGVMRVYRWKDALGRSGDSITAGDSEELSVVFDLDIIPGWDRAEGLELFPCFGENGLLVIYDSPHTSRLKSDREMLIDVFRL